MEFLIPGEVANLVSEECIMNHPSQPVTDDSQNGFVKCTRLFVRRIRCPRHSVQEGAGEE